MLKESERQCIVLQAGKMTVKAENFYAPVGRRARTFTAAAKACRAALAGMPYKGVVC
ncbi:hypothetical protein ACQ0P8_16160 (plasmid) [Halodesulfovibrio aestuarii]|uniref:Uncharacterized protein n=1 Tax=Halodesulfovibrio aestuarii TaxID=126333 RepID=A0A8G2CD17_9BACT|nr:hypothetical protein [Halodesulfovibrio aestuarii]SHJ71669.1 hypothetical protein SAMN05660830_03062 [Halodesulfovibrio aestuarii]